MDEAIIPSTGAVVRRFSAFSADDPNGAQHDVVLDEDGKEVDPKRLEKEGGEALFNAAALTVDASKIGHVAPAAASVSIDPTTNDLTLEPGDSTSETVTVKVPGNTGVDKVDVYFLADTTGSMGSVIGSVQTGANTILTALNGLGLDMAFGVGNYRDFPNDAYAFDHQESPTASVAAVTAAINAWTADGGNDPAEGQLYALDQLAQPPGGAIGWRAGAKRIILWFGDNPGHDPVCAAISGLAYDITEASVTAKLTAENISVLAISTTTAVAGLDGDPTTGAFNYSPTCTIGGSPGQATRITNATNGSHLTGIDATNIVSTIINLVSTAATSINNLSLVPSGGTAPFVVSVSPASGYGPLAGDVDHTLQFEVKFEGVKPCADEDQVFTGSLDAVADGVVVARKRVKITVPACEPKEIYCYSVKYVCGEQPDCDCKCVPVRPGFYATEINIHNFSDREAVIAKHVLPTIIPGAEPNREPGITRPAARDKIKLPPNTATMDDCCRILELLLRGPSASPRPLSVGFLQIVSTEELIVTAVYTATDLENRSVSIDVEQIQGRVKPLKKPRLPGLVVPVTPVTTLHPVEPRG